MRLALYRLLEPHIMRTFIFYLILIMDIVSSLSSGLPDFRTFRLPDSRTFGLSDFRSFGLSDFIFTYDFIIFDNYC